MDLGFLRLCRGYFNTPEWHEKRVFSRAEAWLDLLQFAAFAPTERFINGKSMHHMIGEFVAAERFLEKRWSWSRTKVRNFIAYKLKNHELDQRKDQGLTVLRVCSYETYISGNTVKDTKESTKDQTGEEPRKNHRSTKDKKDKKVKKVRSNTSSSYKLDDAKAILRYLNQKANRNYRDVPAHLDLIRSRLKETGVTVEGVRSMIDAKCADWLSDPERSAFLRPQTLFNRSKFADYYDNRNQTFKSISNHEAGW